MANAMYFEAWSIYQPASVPIGTVMRQAELEGFVFPRDEVGYQQEGMHSVAVEKHMTQAEMIERVMKPLINKCQLEGIDISEIWYVQTSMMAWHDRNFFKSILHRLNLERVPVYAMEEFSCSSLHSVLRHVQTALKMEPQKAVLFIGSDKGFHPLDYVTEHVFIGDSASACLFQFGAEGHQVIEIQCKTDTTVYDNDQEQIIRAFKMYYLHIRQLIKGMLKRNGLGIDDLKLVFCANLPYYLWEAVPQTTGIPMSKFYMPSLQSGCHMTNSDILINIDHAVTSGDLQPGDYYLSLTVGMGGSYGCALHRWCP